MFKCIKDFMYKIINPNYKIKSLAPDEKLKDADTKMYCRHIDTFIKSPHVRNIAITGDLGIGKSTLIRNYEKNGKHRFRWFRRKKFAYLSVIDLFYNKMNDVKNGKSPSKDHELEACEESPALKLQTEIEIRILKQLLVICKKADIQGSHYKAVPEKKSMLIPCILAVLAIFAVSVKFKLLNDMLDNELYVMGLIFMCSILLFYILFSSFRYYKLPSFEFSFGNSNNNGKVQTDAIEDNETLDKNLNDIVYVMEALYKKTNHVLVIEDLDRYDLEVCIPILEKLREINILINQRLRYNCRIRKKKPFKFIYILNDAIFSDAANKKMSASPTKFFDGIVPIVPKLGHTNSSDYLSKIWEKYDLEPEFVNSIAPYIYDYREIRSIENEFRIFIDILKNAEKEKVKSKKYAKAKTNKASTSETDAEKEKAEKKKNTELMALSIYKFFFPDKYYKLRTDNENELMKYLKARKLYEISNNRSITDKNVPVYSKPDEPNDKRKAILLEAMSIDVIRYIFPNSSITVITDKFNYLDRLTLTNDGEINIDKVREVTDEIYNLLKRNDLYSEDFKRLALYYDNKFSSVSKRYQAIIPAIENEEFKTYYQPIISTADGSILGYEVLARWEIDDTIINPAEFIPLIKDQKLITKFDELIVELVLKDIANYTRNNSEGINVFINISISQDNGKTIFNKLKEIADNWSFPNSSINIEISETEINNSESFEIIKDTIKELKDKGFKTWIDNYGINTTSLKILRNNLFEGVKIDRSLLTDDTKNKEILKSLFDLIKQMDKKVIAEGIETIEEVENLYSIGCDYLQGFYFRKPAPLKNLTKTLKEDIKKKIIKINNELKYKKGTDFSGENFEFVNLERFNFAGVILNYANFKKANLFEANLKRASLIKSKLEYTNLERANLEGANLEGANLKGAILDNATLIGTNLAGANLEGATLIGIDLTGANLVGSKLSNINLEGAILNGVNLKRADLTNAYLAGVNLEGAYLKRTNLTGANLENANLVGAKIKGTNLETAKLKGAKYSINGENKTIFPDGFDPKVHEMIEIL